MISQILFVLVMITKYHRLIRALVRNVDVGQMVSHLLGLEVVTEVGVAVIVLLRVILIIFLILFHLLIAISSIDSIGFIGIIWDAIDFFCAVLRTLYMFTDHIDVSIGLYHHTRRIQLSQLISCHINAVTSWTRWHFLEALIILSRFARERLEW